MLEALDEVTDLPAVLYPLAGLSVQHLDLFADVVQEQIVQLGYWAEPLVQG